jgi:methyltransferase
VSGTLIAYLCLVAGFAAERLLEVAIARRNLAGVRRRGGFVAERRTTLDAVVVQAVWMAACAAEAVLLRRPFLPALAAPMLLLLAAAMALRYWSVATLGDRWNLAVVVVPGEPVVTSGPYRWVRHPNYLAVLVEALALPLVHGAWLTAALLGPAIWLLTGRRIRLEEAALAGSGDYERAFAGTRRLLP